MYIILQVRVSESFHPLVPSLYTWLMRVLTTQTNIVRSYLTLLYRVILSEHLEANML